MIKMVTLLKRREGMSVGAFRQHYESHHRLIGEKYLRGFASRYVRRYLQPLPHPLTGKEPESAHDVLMEIWFPDQKAMDEAFTVLQRPEVAAEIAEDEERLFDRAAMQNFIVDEVESIMEQQD